MYRFVFVIAALISPVAASADQTFSTGSGITATVPEVCQIKASIVAIDRDASKATGSIYELCNSGRAFRIVASHRKLADGETIEITYGGNTTALDASGVSDIGTRKGPIARAVPFGVRSSGLIDTVAISLGIAAI